MSLSIRRVVSEGISVATSRSGAVLALLFFVAESLGVLLMLVAGTTYVPVDIGTGVTGGPEVAAGGELPASVAAVTSALTGVFTAIVTIPITIVAIRTFVGGATDGIPDAYLFDRIGRATASAFGASLLYGLVVVTISFVSAFVLLAAAVLVGGTDVATSAVGLLAFATLAFVIVVGTIALFGIVWLHTLFLLHEVSVRDRGALGAFRGSWAAVRGNRLKLAALAGGLVVIRGLVSWVSVPSGYGGWSTLQLLLTPIGLAVTAVVGVYVTAILARAYRRLRPDVGETFT
ncbi:hypothetical protein [Halovivax cerinus]|uniref:DUF7847 domain-containing protein n=1 Tax=Halovivax cerinus TaxID=1487865 RepID=A0ABD5NK57_9EURY|nr:hypothetical protein [Halovivax cerinus]